jgi:hypothetical protein
LVVGVLLAQQLLGQEGEMEILPQLLAVLLLPRLLLRELYLPEAAQEQRSITVQISPEILVGLAVVAVALTLDNRGIQAALETLLPHLHRKETMVAMEQ